MTILITAGPTREPIDPVRYLSNYSSGKMGYAIAEAAARDHHRVILISGPTSLEIPSGVDYLPVETADEMAEAVSVWLGVADIAIMTAAVADYRVKDISLQKRKKDPDRDEMTLELIKNRDILAEARSVHQFPGLLVGFAAETESLIENAQAKLARKGCDLLMANDVSNSVFGSDQNTLVAVFPDRIESLGSHSKAYLGERIIDLCVRLQKENSIK